MRSPSSVTLLLLCLLLLVAGGLNSVKDALQKKDSALCGHCSPDGLLPVGIVLPALLLDLRPELLAPLLLPGLFQSASITASGVN